MIKQQDEAGVVSWCERILWMDRLELGSSDGEHVEHRLTS